MQWPICTDQTNDVDPLGAKVLGPYFLWLKYYLKITVQYSTDFQVGGSGSPGVHSAWLHPHTGTADR